MSAPETHLERALSFFSLEGLGAAAQNSSFDQEDFVRRTIKIAKSEDPKVAIQGLKLFWSVSKDILNTSGLLTQVTQTQDTPNGTITASSQQLLDSLASRRTVDHGRRARPRINAALTHLPSSSPSSPALPAPLPEPGPAREAPPEAV